MKARTILLCFLAYGLIVGSLNSLAYKPSVAFNSPTWFTANLVEDTIRGYYEGKLERALPAIKETKELMGDIREEARKSTPEEQKRLVELKEEARSQRDVDDRITGEMVDAMSRSFVFFRGWYLIPTSALIWGLVGVPFWLVQRYREAHRE